MKKLLQAILTIALALIAQSLPAQTIGIKTDVLADAFTNINLGFEVGLSQKWSLDVSGEYNPFTFSDNRKWKHLTIQPEARYWFCQKMFGHFIGINAAGGKYNVGNIDADFKFLGTDFGKLKNYRFAGWFVGAGIAYGYTWMLSKHWNLEAEIGIGWSYTRYDQYECVVCGKKLKSDAPHNFVGPNKAVLNLVYVF